jgi:hypothetical protein
MTRRHKKRTRAGRLAALLAGVGLLGAAAAAGFIASDDFRAAAATRALAAAGGADASQALRDNVLAAADAALAPGAPSAELADLAASRALLSQPADLDRAEAFTRAALRRSPARAGSWARLAYIDTAREGELGPEGLAALVRSYEVQPFAPESLMRWRVEFVLSRWAEVDEDLRNAALREIRGATAGGSRWYENSQWAWGLSDRLPEDVAAALLEVTPPKPY